MAETRISTLVRAAATFRMNFGLKVTLSDCLAYPLQKYAKSSKEGL
jgi:hypothetical protein